MINLSTKPEEMLAVMKEELPHVRYFARKPYGSKHKFAAMEDKLLDKALAEEKAQHTELQYYISKDGNRWMMYTQVDYYPKAKYANALHVNFIYYETYGSCGAFFPLITPEKKDPHGVVIFTSHFFYQMSERTGKEYRSKELIREFVETRITNVFQADEDGEVIVKFMGGYGWGKLKSDNPMVMEVRTFLTTGQLNNKQKRKVEKVDAMYELIGEGMFMKDVAVGSAYFTYNTPEKAAAECSKKWKAAEKLGIEREMALASIVTMCYVRLLQEILHMDLSPAQITYIGSIANECCYDFVMKYKDSKEETDEFRKDLVDVMVKIAKRMKLKSVNYFSIISTIERLKQENEQNSNKNYN